MNFDNEIIQIVIMTLKFLKVFICTALIGFGSFSALSGCQRKSSLDSVRPNMQKAYRTTSELYKYVWHLDRFVDKKNEDEIALLLSDLLKTFHTIDEKQNSKTQEPGFKISLLSNKQMIQDILLSFKEGNKVYANRKLRGLTANCISCHSRYQAPADFVGFIPESENNNFDDNIALAEFLIATRQFQTASERLYRLALESYGRSLEIEQSMQALKLLLLVEIRVKNRPQELIKKLQSLVDKTSLESEQREKIEGWIYDLSQLPLEGSLLNKDLTYASGLLDEVVASKSVSEDEHLMVKTLKASAVLHSLLDAEISDRERREAYYLLFISYLHLPIETFSVFRDLYLEQCIREYPGTSEAKRAYLMFKSGINAAPGASGRIKADPMNKERLKRLKRLAYG